MRNFKNSFKILTAMAFLNSILSLAQNPTANKAPIVTLVPGPTGQLVPASTVVIQPQTLSCVVNGITITTSGTVNYSYVTPPAQNTACLPAAAFTGLGNWTGYATTGTVVYTFNPAVLAARVSYSAINTNDVGTLTTNSASTTQLTELCGVSGSGAILSCNFANSFGNVGVTVSSATPFTTITLTNTGGQSGWVNGDPCNFVVTPVPPSTTIVNCPKVALETKYFHATAFQDTTLSVFTAGSSQGCNGPATINGVPCTAANVTIEPITPLVSGCTFNANGTIRIPAGTLPFDGETYYRLRSIANPNIYSQNFRVNYGVYRRVFPATNNGFSFYLQTPTSIATINNYTNGSLSVLTGSTINANVTGFYNSTQATASNVTISNIPTLSTDPSYGDQFFMVNAAGDVVYRPGVLPSDVSVKNSLSPNTQYIIKYSICLTGSTVFCGTSSFVFNYTSVSNRFSTNNNNLETLAVLPNPSTDGVFKLEVDEAIKSATIEVYTMMGQKVYEERVTQLKEHELILDKLPKGTYLLKILADDQNIIKNIVKQ
jgi:hypothetical protein